MPTCEGYILSKKVLKKVSQYLQPKNEALQPWKHLTSPPPSTEMNTNMNRTSLGSVL